MTFISSIPKHSYTGMDRSCWQNHSYKKMLLFLLQGEINLTLKLIFAYTTTEKNDKHKEISI